MLATLIVVIVVVVFVIVVAVESACDGRFVLIVPFWSKYQVRASQNVAKQVEIASILQFWAKIIKDARFWKQS